MRHDVAVTHAAEPAADPAASGPGHRSRLDRLWPGRGGPSALVAWLLLVVATVAMLATTPVAAGPDEPVHDVTAWYLSGHGLPPDSPVSFSVPASLWIGISRNGSAVRPCYGGKVRVSAACVRARSMSGSVTVTATVNYPPPYYWVVGIGERLAALVGDRFAYLGGRLASVALNLGIMLLLCIYMRRRHPRWGTFLLLISTPMVIFLGVVVNPSGWEITCGVVLAAILSEAAWSRRPVDSDEWSWTGTAILVLASIGLSTARPIGFIWATGLAVAAVALAPTFRRRAALRIAAAVAPGVVLGVLWLATHPNVGGSLQAVHEVLPLTPAHLALWFGQSLLIFPRRLDQMFGNLGWLDTDIPPLLLLALVAGWAALLSRLPSMGKIAVAGGIFGCLILPSALEAVGWSTWPGWWQGRYTLPFALGFMLMLLLRSGHGVPRITSIVAAISVFAIGIMVWVNAARYAFGLGAYGLPLQLGHSAISVGRLGIAGVGGAVLIVAAGLLILEAARREPDGDHRLDPDVRSAGAAARGPSADDLPAEPRSTGARSPAARSPKAPSGGARSAGFS